MAEYFDNFANANSLYEAYQNAKIGSNWKASVQGYGKFILLNILELQRSLREGTYCQKPFVEFQLHERGKVRHIKSMHIRDRVVQRSLCDEVLTPCLQPALIHDNGASTKGKGIDFTRRRLQCHLEKFFRRHGVNGYILKIDFSKFFDNIDHELALQSIASRVDDPLVMNTISRMIESFEVDISALSREEAAQLENAPFDSLHYSASKEGKRFLKRSMGIGSQISQIVGIYYPTTIDFYCKVRRRCKYYGRYMDDIYIIHEDKRFLEDVLKGIYDVAKELKLFVNPKKTTISPLHRGFTFMKVRYSFTPTGRIIKRLVPETFTRERRRLKTYRRLLDAGRVTRKDVANFYQSFRGTMKRFDSYRSLQNLDRLYNELFVNN